MKTTRKVHFQSDPILSISRRPTDTELKAMTRYDSHVDFCARCKHAARLNAIQKARRRFCSQGRDLIANLASFVYDGRDGSAYSTGLLDAHCTRVEIPVKLDEVRRLLCRSSKSQPRHSAIKSCLVRRKRSKGASVGDHVAGQTHTYTLVIREREVRRFCR